MTSLFPIYPMLALMFELMFAGTALAGLIYFALSEEEV